MSNRTTSPGRALEVMPPPLPGPLRSNLGRPTGLLGSLVPGPRSDRGGAAAAVLDAEDPERDARAAGPEPPEPALLAQLVGEGQQRQEADDEQRGPDHHRADAGDVEGVDVGDEIPATGPRLDRRLAARGGALGEAG